MPGVFDASGPGWFNGYKNAIGSAAATHLQQDSDILDRRAGSIYSAQQDQDAQASRQMQLAALAQQYTAAQGNGPSAAASQQRALGGQALLSALANRSMGGASSGMSAAAQQAAQTREGEMQQAMRGYGEGTGQLRGSELAYQQNAYNLGNAQNQINLAQAAQNQAYTQGLEQHQYDTGLAWTKDAQARHGMVLQRHQAVQEKYRKAQSAALAGAITLATMGAAAPVAGKYSDAITGA
ncbi:MAG: hypothetical protein EBR82_12185 [Caulobacteraceae bacterium]|nr:hypothetical protein [Caulobacteraceae bacterium]